MVSAAVVLAAGLAAGATQGQASIRAIGYLPGQFDTTARDLDVTGTVVAAFGRTPDNIHRAIRFTASGGSEELEILPGSLHSLAHAISDDGTKIGGYCQVGDRPIATIWDVDGSVIAIGDILGSNVRSYIYAMSADGAFATGGWEDPTTSTGAIFRWSESDGFQPLTPVSYSGIGKGISSDGRAIIFTKAIQENQRPFRWTESNGAVNLGVLAGGNFGYAEGISDDSKTVVGGSGFAIANQSQWQHAFVWTSENGMQDLGVLDQSHDISVAYKCNHNGSLVCGTSGIRVPGQFRAFVWTRQHGMLDLRNHLISQGANMTGWNLETVIAVSADGSSVAGRGIYQGQSMGWVVNGLDLVPACLPDTNHDGILSPADFTAWIAAFNVSAPECDQNSDGSCTPADFTAWIANSNAGCP